MKNVTIVRFINTRGVKLCLFVVPFRGKDWLVVPQDVIGSFYLLYISFFGSLHVSSNCFLILEIFNLGFNSQSFLNLMFVSDIECWNVTSFLFVSFQGP